MQHLLTDLRYGLRQARNRPGTTLAIVFVLTVGMTIAAALFSFVRGWHTAPPPGITAADDLVTIRGVLSKPWLRKRLFSREELRAQQQSPGTFAAIAGFTHAVVAVDRPEGGDPQWIEATFVTDGYFKVLGVPVVAGTDLDAAAHGDPLVAVVSRALRERHFATDQEALGKSMTVGGRAVTVVGVAPERFRGVETGEVHGLWLPEAAYTSLVAEDADPLYGSFARLAPGVTLEAASAAMQAIAVNATQREIGDDPREVRTTDVVPLAAMRSDPLFEREIGGMTAAVSLLGLLVLVVTGTNASALQTGVAMTRGREIATRLSLGASRLRVLRQLLVESSLLGLVAAGLAVSLLLVAERPLAEALVNFPFPLALDATATLFTLGVGLAAGVLAGMSPALYAVRSGVAAGLKSGAGATSAQRNRLQRGLVVAQVLLTQPLVVMLAAMLLLVMDQYQRLAVDASADQVVKLELGAANVEAARLDAAAETRRLAHRLESLPGVARAIPDPGASTWLWDYTATGSGATQPFELQAQMVAPGWFDLMGRTLVAGRGFAPVDAAPMEGRQERPVVIGDDLAAALWPGASPIGQRLSPPPESRTGPLLVVGVTPTPPQLAQRGGAPFVVYLPSLPHAEKITLLLRVHGSAESALPAIRSTLRQAAPGLAIVELRTLADIENEVRGQYLMASNLFAGLGLLALLIAAIGLYAVVAFAVAQRVREIAVRLAIGARAGQVVRRTMGDGLRLVVIALVLGLPASLAGLALVTSTTQLLPPVPVWQVGLIAMLAIAVIAGTATWLPARRAARVDPAQHLRSE